MPTVIDQFPYACPACGADYHGLRPDLVRAATSTAQDLMNEVSPGQDTIRVRLLGGCGLVTLHYRIKGNEPVLEGLEGECEDAY